MNVSGTMNSATGHKGGLGDGLYDRAGARPDLDLDFARTKSLKDRVSKEDLITFTRSSGNTGYGATYVDENGLVKVSPVNLLKYSEQLDHSTWSKTGTITENNVVAPDGTTTADTWSVDSTRYAFRNDTAGAWMSAHNQPLYPFTITDEWVRYSISVTTESGQDSLRVYPLRSNDNQDFVYQANIPVTQNTNYVFSAWYKKVGTKVYVWGCQLEKGSVATEYIPTTSQVSGAPRFTHDPETLESKGLLVEQAATNLAIQSEAIGNTTPWLIQGGSIVSDTNVVTPDGTTGANKYIPDTNVAQNHIVYFADTTTGTIALSLFVKPAGLNHVNLISQRGAATSRGVTFNLTEGSEAITASANANGVIEKYPNGWYRIIVIPTSTGATGITHYVINPHDGTAATSNYSRSTYGNSNTTNGMYLWGAQHEVGTTATSYIPTSGSTVTRSSDLASIEGDNFGTYRKNITNSTNHLGFYASSSPRWLYGNTGAAFNLDSYSYENPIDGKHNAALISSTLIPTTENRLKFDNGSTIGPANNHVFSVYVKAVSNPCRIQFFTNVNTNERVVFNLITNNVFKGNTNDSAEIQNVGTDGWKRLIWEPSDTGNFQAWNIHIRCSTDNEARNGGSSGGSGTNEFYIYGPQLEEANDVTPYIPSTDTFDNRQSNATFVDGNGIIRRSMCNQLLYSEGFDNSYWTKNQVAATANSGIAPDGTNTAFKVEATALNTGQHYIYKSFSINGTISVYAKANGYNYFSIISQRGGTSQPTQAAGVSVNLTNGSIHDIKDGTAEVIDVGSGWYRIIFSRTDNLQQVYAIFQPHDGNTIPDHNDNYRVTYSGGAGTGGVLLWGAMQTNDLTEAGDYYKTTDTISGPARYSHDPETLTPTGLYLEPEIDNKATTTETFTDSNYILTHPTNTSDVLANLTTDNSITNPDGSTGTVLMTIPAGEKTRHYVKGIRYQGLAYATQTLSCFVKKKTSRYVGLSHGGAVQFKGLVFDFDTEAITTEETGTNFTSHRTGFVKYPNGWYRLFSQTTGATGSDGLAVHIPKDPTTSKPITGNDTVSYDGTESVYIWGLNCCDVGFLSTYIPNTTTSEIKQNPDTFTSTATEVLDRANGTKPGYFTTEGLTLRCDCKYNNERQLATLGDGTIPSSHSYNRIFDFRDSSSSVFKAFVNNFATYTTPPKPVLAVYGGDMYTAQVYDVDDTHHLVFRYQQNNSNLRIKNTDTNSNDTSMTVGKPTSILIGRSTVNGQEMNGTINRLTIWKIPFDEAKPNPNAGSTMRKLAK